MATYFKTFWKPWMTLNAPPNLWLLFQAKMNDKSWSKPIIENFLNVMNVCEVDIRGKAHDPGILSCPPLQGFCNVLKYSTELSKQRRHETDTMDMSAQMNVCIGTDEHQHQLEHIRKEKIFSFVIHCDSFALWCIVVKNKTKSQVWRSSIVAHSKELFRRDFRRD